MIKLLKKYKFKDIKIKITGIHPERIINNQKLLKNKLIVKLVIIVAKIFMLGDTFEIYAKK